jgi:putative transposase
MVAWFGEIRNGQMVRNEMGDAAHRIWQEFPAHHKNAMSDVFVVMPNHVHGIVVLCCDPVSDVACNVAPRDNTKPMSMISPMPGSLGAVIRSYKSAVTNWCHANDHPDFAWQPRFHDHVIRNDKELNAIREYIINNPLRWEVDHNNPAAAMEWFDPRRIQSS